MKFFVMLNTQSGRPIPMLAEADANRAAEANPLGEAYGYETYEWSTP